MKNKAIQYYKVIQSRQEYLGNRYFRYDYDAQICVQVCLSMGEKKKGKGHNFGIYTIHKMTFFSNYLAMGYCQIINKAEFDKKFNEVIEVLK